MNSDEELNLLNNRQSKNHIVLYNHIISDMGYIGDDQKEQFRFAAMKISDNLGTGSTPTNVGYIKTPKGKIYEIKMFSKLAKDITNTLTKEKK